MTRSEENYNRNDGNSTQSKSTPKRQPSQEAAIFNTFALIVRNKFVLTPSSSSPDPKESAQDHIHRIDELYSNPAYSAEKNMLQKMNNNGMAYGLACGLLTFGFLRSGPKLMQRYLTRRYMKQQGLGNRNVDNTSTVGGYTFDQPRIQGGMGGGDSNSVKIPKPGIFLRTLRLGLDLTVSVFMAAYGSLVFVDRKKLMDDISKIPLVEGRSLVSDELCDEFVDVYRRIPKQIWDKYQGKSDALDAISGFVRNCLRREMTEKKILQQRRRFGLLEEEQLQEEGLSSSGALTSHDSEQQQEQEQQQQQQQEQQQQQQEKHTSRRKHVPIPSPGVSPDIPVHIEWIDSHEGDGNIVVGGEIVMVVGDGYNDHMDDDDDDDNFSNFDELFGQDDDDLDVSLDSIPTARDGDNNNNNSNRNKNNSNSSSNKR